MEHDLRIIVADDEPAVRDGIAMLLECTYADAAVYGASSFPELLAQLQDRPSQYLTVAFTDLMEGNVPQALEQMLHIDPGMHIYIMTGHDVQQESVQELRRYGVRGFIQKPAEGSAFEQVIEEEIRYLQSVRR